MYRAELIVLIGLTEGINLKKGKIINQSYMRKLIRQSVKEQMDNLAKADLNNIGHIEEHEDTPS